MKYLAALFMHKEDIGDEKGIEIVMHLNDAEYLLLISQAIIRYVQEIVKDGKLKL